MKAVERAQASNPQFQVVLKESKDPTGPPAEHLQRTVPKDIKVVVGSDEDIVFFRLKNEPDIPIRKGTGRTVVVQFDFGSDFGCSQKNQPILPDPHLLSHSSSSTPASPFTFCSICWTRAAILFTSRCVRAIMLT